MRSTADLDLPLTFSPADARPLCVQLAGALRDAVHAGLLRPGDRLPPSRVLAQRLSISRGTVTAAFDQLDGEGYLHSTQGAGTFINTEISMLGRNAPASATPGRPLSIRTDSLDLTPGQPDTSRLADPAWRAAWKIAADSQSRLAGQSPLGFSELRSAVVEHVRIARGLSLELPSVMITAGTSEGLTVLIHTLGDRTRRQLTAAVEDPGYPTARKLLDQLGVRVIAAPVDADGLVVAALPRGPRAPDLVFTTPSHQYPLGGRLPVSRRLALLDWAKTHHCVVVEDDYDSEFRHTGAPLPALAALDSDLSSVVHLGTFSKVLTPSLRAGYLAASPALMARMLEVRCALGNPVPSGTQLALARYLESGGLRRHIARTRRDYRHRRELLIRTLADCPQIQARALAGGLHAVLDLTPGTDVPALLTAAEQRGLLVANLADYYADPTCAPGPGLVLGYGGATSTELRSGLQIIMELVRS